MFAKTGAIVNNQSGSKTDGKDQKGDAALVTAAAAFQRLFDFFAAAFDNFAVVYVVLSPFACAVFSSTETIPCVMELYSRMTNSIYALPSGRMR